VVEQAAVKAGQQVCFLQVICCFFRSSDTMGAELVPSSSCLRLKRCVQCALSWISNRRNRVR
jgi:hypothetical protein